MGATSQALKKHCHELDVFEVGRRNILSPHRRPFNRLTLGRLTLTMSNTQLDFQRSLAPPESHSNDTSSRSPNREGYASDYDPPDYPPPSSHSERVGRSMTNLKYLDSFVM